MKTPETYIVLAIILELYFSHSDTSAVITTIGSLREKGDFECETDIVIICSTQPNPLKVVWKIDDVRVADCTFGVCSNDMSIPAIYTFSDNVTEGVFHFNIQPVSIQQNGKTFSCEEGSASVDHLTAEVNVVPDNASNSFDVTSDTQIIFTTGCVYPETEVTIEWYIYKAGMDAVPYTQRNPIRTTNSTGCSSGNCTGSVRISSTLTIPITESGDLYNFQVIVRHSSTSNIVMETEPIKKYRLNVSDNSDGPNNNGMSQPMKLVLSICVVILVLVGIPVVYKLDKPKPISSFAVKEWTDTSVNVEWDTDTSCLYQKNCILKCCLPDGQVVSKAQLKFTGKDVMTHTFDKLSAGTTYHLFIQAKGKILKTKFRQPIKFRTLGEPGQPMCFIVVQTDITDSSITLQWKPGNDYGFPQKFILTYGRQNVKNDSKTVEVSYKEGRKKQQHKVKKLLERTNYYFQIHASNVIGDSKKVEPIYARTKGKPDEPTDFIVANNSITKSSIVVQWKRGDNCGYQQSFILTYSQNKPPMEIPDDRGKETMEQSFNNLHERTIYSFTIYSKNQKGYSDKVGPILAMTKGKPDQPKDFCLVKHETTETSIAVQWRRGENGGFPQVFNLTCSENGQNNVDPIKVPDDGKNDIMQYYITSLTEAMYYKLSIWAENIEGQSSSDDLLVRTNGKPDQPKGFRVVKKGTTETSIAVEWKPGQNGGLPQVFILTCSEYGQNNGEPIKIADDGKNVFMRYDFTDLTQAMYYKLTILAKNKAGQSSSDDLRARTNGWPDPPTKIRIVHESATKTTVDAEWTRGFDGGFAQTFVLKIFDDDGKLHSEENVVDEEDTDYITHTIKHLSELTTYHLEIFSKNKKGESKLRQKSFEHL